MERATTAASWAATLGLVEVDLFGSSLHPRQQANTGQHSALLDGARGSFLLSVTPGGSDTDPDVKSWTWSSHIRHHISLSPDRERMTYRRWDGDAPLPLPYPSTNSDLFRLLSSLERAPPPRQDDVIVHTLIAYRQLVQVMGTPLDAVRSLNTILAASIAVHQGQASRNELMRASTVKDIKALLPERWSDTTSVGKMAESALSARMGAIVPFLFEGLRGGEIAFDPHLFLRHASSHLYQEAHRDTQIASQLAFPGLSAVNTGLLAGTRDTHFTPIALARLIAQRAISRLGNRVGLIRILDPACGSGVFLQEAIRELIAQGRRGAVELHGIDISEAACEITRFVLAQAIEDARAHGLDIRLQLKRANALETPWPKAEIILMNPPFKSWEAMNEDQRAYVRVALESNEKGRPDFAMAFVWKAVCHLASGGVVGSVLPAPLLETKFGKSWREAIIDKCDFDSVGRLASLSFFAGALVEPAFIVCKLKSESAADRPEVLYMVAEPGNEDTAIRYARIASSNDFPLATAPSKRGVDVYRLNEAPPSESWTPRPRALVALAETVARLGHPRVNELFGIRQGARTGHNKAFLLTSEIFASLPKGERAYFRPAIVNASIYDGQLNSSRYVFFPYESDGEIIGSERALRKAVPSYYTSHLKPFRDELKARAKIDKERWWLLTWGRNWQFKRLPRIVSTYFGEQGSFSLDTKGSFVVVQGFAWHWKWQESMFNADDEGDDEDEHIQFVRSGLAFAYLPLLNSSCFAKILETTAPRISGGQFDLSARYVEQAWLPNLGDSTRVSQRALAHLQRLGKRILSDGLSTCREEVDQISALAYGVPLDLLVRAN